MKKLIYGFELFGDWYIISTYRSKNTYIHEYSHFVPIPNLRTDNSRIEPRKVRILTLAANLGILTLRRAIPELSRFSLFAEHIIPHNEIC